VGWYLFIETAPVANDPVEFGRHPQFLFTSTSRDY
jgi:hypothetical protein